MAQRRYPAGRALLSYVAGATLGQKHAGQFGLVGPMKGLAGMLPSVFGGAGGCLGLAMITQIADGSCPFANASVSVSSSSASSLLSWLIWSYDPLDCFSSCIDFCFLPARFERKHLTGFKHVELLLEEERAALSPRRKLG